MWIFKADISNCFNQLRWSQESVRLMGFILEAGILMIMLKCVFGVGVTPMVWSLIGDAMNRLVNLAKLCRIFTFVDDYMGAGSEEDAQTSQELSYSYTRCSRLRRSFSEKERIFTNH